MVDQVGMSTGSAYGEGTRLTALSGNQNQSYERDFGGVFESCEDDNDNSTDFLLKTPSAPQNSLSLPVLTCLDSYATQTLIIGQTQTLAAQQTQTAAEQTQTAAAFGTQTGVVQTANAQATGTMVAGTQTAAVGTQTAAVGTQTAAAGTQTGVAKTATASGSLTPPTSPPVSVIRSVVINEVAWAGTKADSDDEWIELYNTTSAAINLTDWHLLSTDLSPDIILVGAIQPHSFFLLERSDDAVNNVAFDQLYSGVLVNGGESLQLLNSSFALIDTANVNAGPWPAGSASPNYCTMERISATAADTDSNWKSNNNITRNGLDQSGNQICGTPKSTNSASASTPVKTRTRTPTAIAGTFIPSTIVINEFLPHARSDWNSDGRVDAGDEFIEIKNVSSQAFSLSGWRLDDDTGDSSAFNLPDVSIEGGARLVFFASETNILLSNGGETVRLYKNTGSISDAFTYGVVLTPDQTWCRFPDGLNTWRFGCEPTPQEANRLAQTIIVDNESQSKFCLSPTILPVFYQAECTPSGLDTWSRSFWEWQLQAGFPLYIQPNEQEFITE